MIKTPSIWCNPQILFWFAESILFSEDAFGCNCCLLSLWCLGWCETTVLTYRVCFHIQSSPHHIVLVCSYTLLYISCDYYTTVRHFYIRTKHRIIYIARRMAYCLCLIHCEWMYILMHSIEFVAFSVIPRFFFFLIFFELFDSQFLHALFMLLLLNWKVYSELSVFVLVYVCFTR